MSNPEIALARQIIENTNTHLFLTGKAGTGKTTFLRRLREESTKRMVVLAPTGIAAINAGGVTIHSFFQIPFAPFLPGVQYSRETFRMSERKKRLIRSLDLVVIDEISMVRADLLDNIDAVLRRHRDRHKPFGGVQLLMIGDLQQLAPVVKEEEWSLLSAHYESPFFFSANALRSTDYATVELKTVYRQRDENFIDLLNAVRNNTAGMTELQLLNARYIPNFEPRREEGYVRLVTHNHQADRINEHNLAQLPSKAFTYRAEIKGTFPEYSYPTQPDLSLKIGAQVMFVKNDGTGAHRYFNGMLGEVVSLTPTEICVRAQDTGEHIDVPREEWLNSRYALNETTMQVEEITEGVFRQFPLRTAWAITIHKSQGLTFERAIIDASASFAHGQTYVALSRCKTLEGLVLSAPIPPRAIIQDAHVQAFSEDMAQQLPTPEKVREMERLFFLQLLGEVFSFGVLLVLLDGFLRLLDEYFYKRQPATVADFKALRVDLADRVEAVSHRFARQYEHIVLTAEAYRHSPLLQERVTKAADYFLDALAPLVHLLGNTSLSTNNKVVAKRLKKHSEEMTEELRLRVALLRHVAAHGFEQKAYQQARALATLGETPDSASGKRTAKTAKANAAEKAVAKAAKPPRERTDLISLRMFESGKTVEEIAAERGLVAATVYKHLSQHVAEGTLSLADIVAPDHIARVVGFISEHPDSVSFYELMEALGDDISQAELRLILAHTRSASTS